MKIAVFKQFSVHSLSKERNVQMKLLGDFYDKLQTPLKRISSKAPSRIFVFLLPSSSLHLTYNPFKQIS